MLTISCRCFYNVLWNCLRNDYLIYSAHNRCKWLGYNNACSRNEILNLIPIALRI
jgi:hypothetical protein